MKDYIDTGTRTGTRTDTADLAERIGNALRRAAELEAGRIRAALNEDRLTLDARLRERIVGEAPARIDA